MRYGEQCNLMITGVSGGQNQTKDEVVHEMKKELICL